MLAFASAGASLAGACLPTPASASLLCTVNVSGCSAEQVYEKGEWFTTGAATKSFTIASSFGNVICSAQAAGKITDPGGEGNVNCGAAFKCVYHAAAVSFALTGSSTAPKLAVAQTLERDAASEAECGSSMTWTATYKLAKPVPLFVTS